MKRNSFDRSNKEPNRDQAKLDLIKRLNSAGIQPTAQRIAIAQFVLCEADHPTAEEVKAWADRNFPKVSLATVYNTLNTLVEAGLLQVVKLPHTDKVVFDRTIDDHYHFLDEKSGKVFDLMPDQLEVTPKLRKGFKIRSIQVLIKGEIT